MSAAFDLGAYFERIGWSGNTAPTYDTLASILAAHIERIPFENLDVLLGRGVRLDLPALQDKIVRKKRGGYCFEHATLFATALDVLGFAPLRHSARVVLVLPRHEAPRTHMFLTVTLPEGTFVLDPGFGRQAPRTPVPLREGSDVSDGYTVHWMARDDGLWTLRTRDADRVVDCWVSEVAADNRVDFEMANHFVATHPSSPFVNRMMLRAYTSRGEVTVMNRDVTERDGIGTHRRVLADRSALRKLLREDFGFDLPAVDALRVPSIPEWA